MTMRGTRRSPASRSSPRNTDLGHAQAAPRTGAQGTTRVVTTPESRHRYPSPRRVDHLHRHTPVPSRNCPTPTIWLRDSTSSAEHSGCELYPSRGSPPDRLDAHIDDNIQAKRSSNRWGGDTDRDPSRSRSRKSAHYQGPRPLPAPPDQHPLTHTQL